MSKEQDEFYIRNIYSQNIYGNPPSSTDRYGYVNSGGAEYPIMNAFNYGESQANSSFIFFSSFYSNAQRVEEEEKDLQLDESIQVTELPELIVSGADFKWAHYPDKE